VGWYGIYPFATSSFTNDINLANGPSLLSTFDFSTWLPKPFVWTMASDTMTSLGTTPVNNPATTYTYGEARAITPDGTVAAGWLGNSNSNFEAVRWATTDNWANGDFMTTLQLATVNPDPEPGVYAPIARIGAVANAVDAD
jgi:uncharacterized membrane protein